MEAIGITIGVKVEDLSPGDVLVDFGGRSSIGGRTFAGLEPGLSEKTCTVRFEDGAAYTETRGATVSVAIRTDRPHRFAVGERVLHRDSEDEVLVVEEQSWRIVGTVRYPTYTLRAERDETDRAEDVLCTNDLISARRTNVFRYLVVSLIANTSVATAEATAEGAEREIFRRMRAYGAGTYEIRDRDEETTRVFRFDGRFVFEQIRDLSRCECGAWPVEEYGRRCPSCVAEGL